MKPNIHNLERSQARERTTMRHYDESVIIHASAKEIFDYVDDHSRFSSHMSKSSWMMGGGRMNLEVDEGQGQIVGSHIRMKGKVFGINVFLDEVVTHREPPRRKMWETVGSPKLLVIGNYRMGLEINEDNNKSRLRVFIDYELPTTMGTRWLGYLFAGMYAKWCVRQMIRGVQEQFEKIKK
jgi:hypothetical protein